MGWKAELLLERVDKCSHCAIHWIADGEILHLLGGIHFFFTLLLKLPTFPTNLIFNFFFFCILLSFSYTHLSSHLQIPQASGKLFLEFRKHNLTIKSRNWVSHFHIYCDVDHKVCPFSHFLINGFFIFLHLYQMLNKNLMKSCKYLI